MTLGLLTFHSNHNEFSSEFEDKTFNLIYGKLADYSGRAV
jgi:hypothetical protein